jgi:hypothetical protein
MDDLLADGEKKLYQAHGANEDMTGLANKSNAPQKVEMKK